MSVCTQFNHLHDHSWKGTTRAELRMCKLSFLRTSGLNIKTGSLDWRIRKETAGRALEIHHPCILSVMIIIIIIKRTSRAPHLVWARSASQQHCVQQDNNNDDNKTAVNQSVDCWVLYRCGLYFIIIILFYFFKYLCHGKHFIFRFFLVHNLGKFLLIIHCMQLHPH